MPENYQAAIVLKRRILHKTKKGESHHIKWELGEDGIEDPNADVALLIIAPFGTITSIQHKTRYYKVVKYHTGMDWNEGFQSYTIWTEPGRK